MLLIRAIIRPEKVDKVMKALIESGYAEVSKLSVVGLGKQRGIKIGDIIYDELCKELLMMVVKDEDKDFCVRTIIEAARTEPKGAFGDGKIFISPVLEAYTISKGIAEL